MFILFFLIFKSFLQDKKVCSTNIFMSADKISAPYAIFYTKLGKNLQKFFHWRTLRKSPARSHNKRFFLVSHCGVGGNLRSKPPKGRSPSMEARTTGREFAKQTAEGAEPLNGCPHCGPLNGNPHCGVGGNLQSKPPKGRSPSMEARPTGPLNGSPPYGAPQWEPVLRGRREFAKQTAEGAKPLNGSPYYGPPQWKPALRGPSMDARPAG